MPGKHRTKECYHEAVRVVQNSAKIDYKLTFGIREMCVLNELKYFHIIDNLNVDIMHDLCEGTVQTALFHFFKYILAKKVLSEKELINRITFFDYGVLSRHCYPSRLTLDRKNLNQNASQIKCLIYHIPFIFFDLQSHTELQNIWTCIHSMLKILTICYSSTITERDLKDLESSVEFHLKNMIKLFAIDLKPKHHHMTHYAHVIRNVGPLIHMSTMKYEIKHKDFTKIAKTTNNFRNINETLVNRYLERSIGKKMYSDEISHAVFREFDKKFIEEFRLILNDIVIPGISCAKWLKINSEYYENSPILKIGANFFEILHIIRYKSEYFFICFEYEKIRFDYFMQSFDIREIQPRNFVLIKHSKLTTRRSFEKKKNEGKWYLIVDALDLHD